MYNYYFVNLRVAPKMAALANAQQELMRTEALLDEAMMQLRQVQEGLDMLQLKFRVEQEKKAELEHQVQLCQDRMHRAVKLVSGLAGEQIRWIQTVAEMKSSLVNIVGDILLSSGEWLSPEITRVNLHLP